MPVSYRSVDVKCPFYIFSSTNRMKCEGVDKTNRIHLVFGDSERARDYLNRYCCKNYKQCRIYRMLDEKYTNK